MAIKFLSVPWKADLKARVSPTERVYVDFRQQIYPAYFLATSVPFTYTAIASGDNQPGIYNITAGDVYYLLEMPTKFTLSIRMYPNFAYDTGDSQNLCSWYVDSDNYFHLYYYHVSDCYSAFYKSGGTSTSLHGPTYTDNSHQAWTDLAIAIDTTTGDKTGSAMYINRSAVDTEWSANVPAITKNCPLFQVRARNNTVGDYKINHMRLFVDKVATATEVAGDFGAVKNEEIIWHFNGEGCGRTRVNVTRFVKSIFNEKMVEEPSTGAAGANRFTAVLNSNSGEFADDQYAAFDPTTDVFNGTSAQKYMQHRCRVEAETWYSNDYELFFIGRLDSSGFVRNSAAGILQTVSISAEDSVSELAREWRQTAKSWEDKKISDATETDSLAHLIPRLVTKKPIYNYASNSSFENATIGNSWVVSGGTAPTFTKQNGGIFGSSQGDLVYDDATCKVAQTITFSGTKKLNVGETYNFSIYLKATANADGDINIYEADSGGDKNSSTTAYDTLASAIEWDKFEVSHTITDSDSNRLRIEVTLETNTTLSLDGAMFIQHDRALNWFILNNNDGASGVESADDADNDSYDTIGFNCDAVNITHPWAVISQGDNIWDHIKDLGDAAGAMYNGMDECGAYTLISKLATGYADPSSLETITSVAAVNSAIEMIQANKIIVHGVYITKFSNLRCLWMIDATGMAAEGSGTKPKIGVANGAYWPDATTFPEYWAKYAEISNKQVAIQLNW